MVIHQDSFLAVGVPDGTDFITRRSPAAIATEPVAESCVSASFTVVVKLSEVSLRRAETA